MEDTARSSVGRTEKTSSAAAAAYFLRAQGQVKSHKRGTDPSIPV